VGLVVALCVKARMPAPSGKDADPKESLWDFEGRGRRLAVIGARDFACNVAARPTSLVGRVVDDTVYTCPSSQRTLMCVAGPSVDASTKRSTISDRFRHDGHVVSMALTA